MTKSIWLSILSIFAVLAVVGGLTLAYFSDTGTSSANVFTSGTLDMKLSDSNEPAAENVSGTWGLNSAPGDTFTGDLGITNSGSVPADHVELQFSNVVVEPTAGPGLTGTIPMDTVIEITSLLWDANGDGSPEVDLLPGVSNINANGIIDLDDLENQVADDFDNLAFGGTQSANHVLRIAGRLSPTLAVDQHQADVVTTSLGVTMNQHSSQ